MVDRMYACLKSMLLFSYIPVWINDKINDEINIGFIYKKINLIIDCCFISSRVYRMRQRKFKLDILCAQFTRCRLNSITQVCVLESYVADGAKQQSNSSTYSNLYLPRKRENHIMLMIVNC